MALETNNTLAISTLNVNDTGVIDILRELHESRRIEDEMHLPVSTGNTTGDTTFGLITESVWNR